MRADWGGCGGLRLCNGSSSVMWLRCAPTPRPQRKVTQDTRAKKKRKRKTTKNMQLGAWAALSSFLPLSLSSSYQTLVVGGGLSERQPESGGSPISFVHISPSFSAEPLLPPGKVCPVPVLLRLDSSEATEMKGLEVDANHFLQRGFCLSHIPVKQPTECVLQAFSTAFTQQ